MCSGYVEKGQELIDRFQGPGIYQARSPAGKRNRQQRGTSDVVVFGRPSLAPADPQLHKLLNAKVEDAGRVYFNDRSTGHAYRGAESALAPFG